MTTSENAYQSGRRPRLLFDDVELNALRARRDDSRVQRIVTEMIRRSDMSCDASSDGYIELAGDRDKLFANWSRGSKGGVPLCDAAECSAFAYAFTSDATYRDRAIAMLRAVVGDGTPPRCSQGGSAAAATLEGRLPWVLDILWNDLTAKDQKLAESFLRTVVVEPMGRQLVDTNRPHYGLGINIYLHSFSLYVSSLAAVYRPEVDGDALEKVAAVARRAVHLGPDEGGFILEGPSYGLGDLEWLSFSAEIVRRAGIADFWKEEPRFVEMAKHWVHMILPANRGHHTPGDSWRYAGGRPHVALLLHARRTGDRALAWAWEHFGGRGDVPGIGEAPECFTMHLGPAAVWEGDDLDAVLPDEAGYPSAKMSGAGGFITARSGWKDNDLAVALCGSGRTDGNFIHQHVDAGHLSLFALGEAFSIDTGYGDIAGQFHTIMLPESREPEHPHSIDCAGGKVEAFVTTGGVNGLDYACLDTHDQLQCRSAHRHALVVRWPGAQPYVLLLDNVNHRASYGACHWLLNSEPGNRIEIDATAAERAVIHGRVNRMELAFAYPQAGEYPVRHILELRADEIDSRRIPRCEGDVNYRTGGAGEIRRGTDGFSRWGAGPRPRLVGELSGFNGQMLSALMPREAKQAGVKVTRIHGVLQFGLEIQHGDVIDTVLASPADRRIDTKTMTGEATIVLLRRNAAGDLLHWAACDAFSLNVAGEVLLPRQGVPAVCAAGDA